MDETNGVAKDLVRRAETAGTLSATSARALAVPNIAHQIDLALEESYELSEPGESLLVTLMPDDSGSMLMGAKRADVIQGHNNLITALQNSPAAAQILLQTRYLNGYMLNPFSPLEACKHLTAGNYPCDHGTPLYEQTLVLLGTVLVKAQELTDAGAKVRSATLLMTDAESTDRNKDSLLAEIRSVIRDIRRLGDHIVAGMTFPTKPGDDTSRSVFLDMGIQEDYVISAGDSDAALEAFGVFQRRALELTSGRDE